MQANQKKVVKVTLLGETKRLKVSGDYQALVDQTQKAFGQGTLPAPYKFYYLDPENEIISMSSQQDLEEALSIEDFSVLKLQVAGSVGEARAQLLALHSDTLSMRESLNQSGFFNPAQIGSPFDLGQIASPIVQAQNTQRFEKRSLLESGFEVLSDKAHVPASVTSEVPVPIVTTIQQDPVLCPPSDPKKDIEEVYRPQEDRMEQEVTCFKCLGEKMNKRGRPCKKCEGTGTIRSDEVAQVLDVVRGEIKEYCNNTFTGLFRDYLTKKTEDQANTEHEGVECDGCEVAPVKGIRFKCSVCPDYDLCENCEKQGLHSEHPFLKIRQPSHAPQQFLCQYNPGSVQGAQQQQQEPVQKPAEDKARGFGTKKNPEKAKFVKYSGRFVKESFGDKFVVKSGNSFQKQWTYRNDGKTAWPEDTLFMQTNGDDLMIDPVSITSTIQPEQEHTWTVNGKAPEKPGRYSAYFRMVTGANYRFGHKVWVDILVEEPKEVKSESIVDHIFAPVEQELDAGVDAVMAQEPEPVVVNAEMPYPDLDLSKGDKDGAVINSVEDLMKSVSRTPKEVYEEKAANTKISAAVKANLKVLFDLGFVNFEVNTAMLAKYDNNVEAVAATLCEGMLSESCIQAVFKA